MFWQRLIAADNISCTVDWLTKIDGFSSFLGLQKLKRSEIISKSSKMKIAKSSEIRASRAFRRKMIKISLSRESDENLSNFEEAYCFGLIVGLKFRAEANVTSNLWAKNLSSTSLSLCSRRKCSG